MIFERTAKSDRMHASVHELGAFTLIEIMVAIGIVAIILAIGIPSVYQQLHKDSMRLAIADISELCRDARDQAVLRGATVELRISPLNRAISVNVGTAPTEKHGSEPVPTFEMREQSPAPTQASSPSSRKLSEHIMFRFLEVNMVPNPDLADRSCFFYRDGTSDELGMVIYSDRGEVRKVFTDVVTGMADWEVAQ